MKNQQQLAELASRISDVATWAHVALLDDPLVGRTKFYDEKVGMQKIAELQLLFHDLHTCLHRTSLIRPEHLSTSQSSKS